MLFGLKCAKICGGHAYVGQHRKIVIAGISLFSIKCLCLPFCYCPILPFYWLFNISSIFIFLLPLFFSYSNFCFHQYFIMIGKKRNFCLIGSTTFEVKFFFRNLISLFFLLILCIISH